MESIATWVPWPVLVLLVVLVVALLRARFRIARLERGHAQAVREARLDAARRSRAVSLGKAVEHLVPFAADFPFEPGDARFLGSPVDFVVFDGLRAHDEVEEIVFVEVKTGQSRLTARERSVRRAVEEGRVSWLETRVAP